MSPFLRRQWALTIVTIVSTLALAALAVFAPLPGGLRAIDIAMVLFGVLMSTFMVVMNLRDRRNDW